MQALAQASSLKAPLQALREGRFLMIFDGDEREGETDLFLPAQAANPASIRRLRTEAGGLVFVALGPDVHASLGLPFLQDMIQGAADRWPILRDLVPAQLPYDAKSSFSLTVNHRESFTGITDRDRAMTVRALGQLASLEPCLAPADLRARFTETFRAPGHVHICSAAPRLLADRQGHTELAVALAGMAGVPEAIVGAEILDGDAAMRPDKARAWAATQGLAFITGDEIKHAWRALQEGHLHSDAHR